MRRFALFAALVLASCKGDPKGKVTAPGSAAGSGSAEAVITGEPCKKAVQKGPIAWIEDDYASALACAKQRKVPLVLDLWAPWCHTCISMQTTVFMDASFGPDTKKLVFAALDTDREENAAAVAKFAPSAWPTFYVIGTDETVLARFVGAATLDQFHELLDSGIRVQAGSLAASDVRLLAAQRALAKRDFQTAEEELTAALQAGPDAWLRRPEVLAELQTTKQKRGDMAGCIEFTDAHLKEVGQTAIATNFWATGIECAKEKLDHPKAKPLFMAAIEQLQKTLADKSASLSLDDRTEAMGYLRDALDEIGKHGDAHAVAEESKKLLDDAMASAKTPFERMQFIWPRAEVYAYLEKPLDLVADYEKLSAELPKEYDPPARLGWLYLKAGKYPEAATWTDKALALVYGPRKGRLLAQRADIAHAAGDSAVERKMREDAVKLWETLPEGQQNPDALAKAKEALANLGAGSAAGSGAGSAKK